METENPKTHVIAYNNSFIGKTQLFKKITKPLSDPGKAQLLRDIILEQEKLYYGEPSFEEMKMILDTIQDDDLEWYIQEIYRSTSHVISVDIIEI